MIYNTKLPGDTTSVGFKDIHSNLAQRYCRSNTQYHDGASCAQDTRCVVDSRHFTSISWISSHHGSHPNPLVLLDQCLFRPGPDALLR